MESIRLVHTPSGASAEVYPHSAHVTSWIPAGGTEALFVSRAAHFQPGTAIRGGVPVIFPQFATFGPLPKHGFARLERWSPADSPPSRAVLRLRDSAGRARSGRTPLPPSWRWSWRRRGCPSASP